MATKMTTGEVRFSYCSVWEPRAINEGDKSKYSVQILIPKSDRKTYQKLQEVIKEAADAFRKKNGTASLPANPLSPLHDGDGEKPNGGAYGPECRGHWVLSASNELQPIILDRNKQDILDRREFYSGCYGRASINFYGYSNRRKGVGCSLLGLLKLRDGEPLGGMTIGSADDFDDDFDDDFQDDDDFLR